VPLTKIKDLKRASQADIRRALDQVHVIPRLDSYLEDMNLEPYPKRMGVFSASDIGSQGGKSLCGKFVMGCARVLYYRYCGVEPRQMIKPRIRRIFGTGTAIHEQIQGYLEKIAEDSEGTEIFELEKTVNETNSKVAKKYEITSTTDGVWSLIRNKKLGFRFVLEIKSMKGELFQKLNGPKSEVIVQSNIYMACLDVPFCTILYYNKNDSTWVEYPEVFQQEVWDAVVAKINFVREAAVNEEEPPRETGFHCKECRYNFICKPPRAQRKDVAIGRKRFRMTGGMQ
jgi:CRISPR/Cas system-associated exonuclease Cas4 (RecB family)